LKELLKVSENVVRRGTGIEGISKAGSGRKKVDVREELVG
jgi:hypothetical protein